MSRIGWLFVAFALAASSAAAQTLGDVAQKEAARRKASGVTAQKVYTNDDLKVVPPPSSPAPALSGSAPAQTAADAKKPEENKPPEEEKGESYWRGRMAQAREELRRNEMFRDALQTKINSLSNDFAARDDPAQRAQIANDRQQSLAEQARVTSDIEKNTKAIGDIEEEARQAGVPPGWLR